MKCTDSDVSLVSSRSQYVYENTKFSLRLFPSKQILLLLHSFCVCDRKLDFAHLHGSSHIYMKLFFVCLYECNSTKLQTTYEQAPKTGLRKNISQGKERELDNVQFLRRSLSSLKEFLGPSGRFQGGLLLSKH